MRRMKLNYGLRLTSCLSVVALAVACASAGSDIVVTVAPETPYTLDDLVATVIDDGTVTYSYRWRQDGTVRADLTTSTIANAETTKHEVWLVELLDSNDGTISSDTVTILNSPLTAPVVSVPSAPWLGQPIQCAVDTPSADDDNDTITYAASWTRNGSAYNSAITTTFADDTVPGGQSQPGDVFVCTVTASDGDVQVDAVSNSATVGDCPPAPGPTTFTFTGSMESYVVPACVATVTIETWGAQGTGPGGANGGYAAGTLAVTTGQTLYVSVGGSAGFNGGGPGQAVNPAHGGGASDVRVDGTVLDNRVIVGGGGGGGPTTDVTTYAGGTGGGGTCGANYCGGGGAQGYSGAAGPGGLTGGAGVTGAHGSGGGGGGLQSGGGGACQTYNQPTSCGGTGQLGAGGAGDGLAVQVCFDNYGGTAGGGGGYWGGGGSAMGYCGGGGGGGGSSWTGTLTSPVMNGGVRTGDGQVIITPL